MAWKRKLLIKAQKLGAHTKVEWETLKAEFNYRCVRCSLKNHHLDKDHIKPLYQGGSDQIQNIQPLCSWCNASKGSENFNWVEFRRKYGWKVTALKVAKTHPFND